MSLGLRQQVTRVSKSHLMTLRLIYTNTHKGIIELRLGLCRLPSKTFKIDRLAVKLDRFNGRCQKQGLPSMSFKVLASKL